jgi:membrane-associated phospholipid phosphatase
MRLNHRCLSGNRLALILCTFTCSLIVGDACFAESTGRNFVLLADHSQNSKITATTTRHHSSMFSLLKQDAWSLATDHVFVGIISAMAVTPSLVKYEDPEINRMLAGEGTADAVFDPGDPMGSTLIPLGACGASLILHRIMHNTSRASFANDLFRAHLFNAAATLSLKFALNRTRPDGGSLSFPSGHTSTAFTSAAVIYSHFGKYWGLAAMSAATYVGLSRLQENRHFPSDVLAGAILGSYIGFKISSRSRHGRDISMAPYMNNGAVGGMLTAHF